MAVVEISDINEFQAINSDTTGDYVLVNTIDASATATWNSGAGFEPIGGGTWPYFSGTFDGQGYSVADLYIDRAATQHVGLFSRVTGTVQSVGVVDCDITGGNRTGAICGSNEGGERIRRCWSTGSVTGAQQVGGISGRNWNGEIENSWSGCAVHGSRYIGGLVGSNGNGYVEHSYCYGAVTGAQDVFGLSAFSNSNSVVVSSYWNTETSGQATSKGGTGKTTAEMYTRETFDGWDFDYTWGIEDYGGYPFLLVFGARRFPASAAYYLELRDSDGDLLRWVRDWYGGRLEETVNEPRHLDVRLPHDDDVLPLLEPPNEIWLRDKERVLIDRFSIAQVRVTGVAERRIEVLGTGLLGSLGRVWVTEYIEEGKTVAEILTALLGLQSAISLGGVDVVGTYTVQWESMSVLQCLQALHKQAGGYYWIVPQTNELFWLADPGEFRGRQIRFRKNLKEIRREKDYTGIANQVYAQGDGVALASPLEDAGSIAAYGVRAFSITDKRVKHEATLTAMAQRVLDERKDPITQYTVSAIDLSQLLEGDYRFEAWKLGDDYRVIDDVYGIDETVRALKITRDLDNPLQNQIELVSLRRPLSDLLGQIKEDVMAVQQVAADVALSDSMPTAIGTTAGPGTSEEVSRADHAHDLSEALGEGGPIKDAIDAAVDEAGPDAATVAPPDVDDTGAVGTSENYAREDHTHGGQRQPSDTAPEAVGSTASAGTSDEYSRADHVHEGITQSDVNDAVGNALSDDNPENTDWDNAAGSSEEVSRADHVHINDGRMLLESGLTGAPNSEGRVRFVEFDGQIWGRLHGQDRWYPLQKMTTESGEPE